MELNSKRRSHNWDLCYHLYLQMERRATQLELVLLGYPLYIISKGRNAWVIEELINSVII